MRIRTAMAFSLLMAFSTQAMQDEKAQHLPLPGSSISQPITYEQFIQEQLQQSSGIKRCLFAAADACMALKEVANMGSDVAVGLIFFALNTWQNKYSATTIAQAASRACAAEQRMQSTAASIANAYSNEPSAYPLR